MMKKEGWVSEFGSCVNRQVGLGFHCFILYPIVPPSLTVSVDVKHVKEEGWVSELRSCEQQEVGLSSPSLFHSSLVAYSFCGRKA